ncbi:AF4/FMR2 family member 4 [Cyclospora cayetanensis]|uniref:AF4/FMR2 family member 4 n=1 Tax=Cyclospora cayetanensis TaxID=88456 RepID=A0A6P6S1N7_9EIME|nr:AF4/FMR2 family member 4 [Cyclospora cayetanensis]
MAATWKEVSVKSWAEWNAGFSCAVTLMDSKLNPKKAKFQSASAAAAAAAAAAESLAAAPSAAAGTGGSEHQQQQEYLQREIESTAQQLAELQEQHQTLKQLLQQCVSDAERAELADAAAATAAAVADTASALELMRTSLVETRKLQVHHLLLSLQHEQRQQKSADDGSTSDSAMSVSDGELSIESGEDTAPKSRNSTNGLSGSSHGKTPPSGREGSLCVFASLQTNGRDGLQYGRVRAAVKGTPFLQQLLQGTSTSTSTSSKSDGSSDICEALPAGGCELRTALLLHEQKEQRQSQQLLLQQQEPQKLPLLLLIVPACPEALREAPCRHILEATEAAAAAFQAAAAAAQQQKVQEPHGRECGSQREAAAAAGLQLEVDGAAAAAAAAAATTPAGTVSLDELRESCPFNSRCGWCHGVLLPPAAVTLVQFSAHKIIEQQQQLQRQQQQQEEGCLVRGSRVIVRLRRQQWQPGSLRQLLRKRKHSAAKETEVSADVLPLSAASAQKQSGKQHQKQQLQQQEYSWFARVLLDGAASSSSCNPEGAADRKGRLHVCRAQHLVPSLIQRQGQEGQEESGVQTPSARRSALRSSSSAGSSSSSSSSSESEVAIETDGSNGDVSDGEKMHQQRKVQRLQQLLGKPAATAAAQMLRRAPRCHKTSWWQPLRSTNPNSAAAAGAANSSSKKNCCPLSSSSYFGVWMLHTSGVGLRIMERLGYKLGECLGKRQRLLQQQQQKEGSEGLEQGLSAEKDSFLLNPLPIEILPSGYSLDYIRCPRVRRAAAAKEAAKAAAAAVAEEGDGAFRLIRGVGQGAAAVASAAAAAAADERKKQQQQQDLQVQQQLHRKYKKSDEQQMRRELLQLQQQVQQVQSELEAAAANCRRHQGTATEGHRVHEHYQQQHAQLQEQKRQLQQQQKLLERMLPTKKTNKLSKIF